MADLLAELDGYRSELEGYKRQGRKERAQAVQGEVDRVVTVILAEVDRLVAEAEAHEEAGQDVLAARARVRAKEFVRGLPEDKRPARLRPLFHDGAEGAVADESETATKRGRAAKEA